MTRFDIDEILAGLITYIQIEYWYDGVWIKYKNLQPIFTGQLATDGPYEKRVITLSKFLASKVKVTIPRAGRGADGCGGRLEVMVSPIPSLHVKLDQSIPTV